MNNNGCHFIAHDPYGFEKFLLKVEFGKGSISGMAMLPQELVTKRQSHGKLVMISSRNVVGLLHGNLREKKIRRNHYNLMNMQYHTLSYSKFQIRLRKLAFTN